MHVITPGPDPAAPDGKDHEEPGDPAAAPGVDIDIMDQAEPAPTAPGIAIDITDQAEPAPAAEPVSPVPAKPAPAVGGIDGLPWEGSVNGGPVDPTSGTVPDDSGTAETASGPESQLEEALTTMLGGYMAVETLINEHPELAAYRPTTNRIYDNIVAAIESVHRSEADG